MTIKPIVLCCLFFLLSSLLYSFDISQPIKVGTVENLPPFSFYEKGQLKGIDIEVINELSKRLNLNIEIETLPWLRVINELKNGDLDSAFSLYYVEDRKSFITYLSIMHYDNLGLMTRNDNMFHYRKTEDLYNKVIGKGNGVFVSSEFTKAEEEKRFIVEEINDTEMGNLKKLKANRIDAVIGVVETMKFYAKVLGYDNQLQILNEYIDSNRPGYFVVSNKSLLSNEEELLKKISKEISIIMTDGTYKAIKDKYTQYF